MTDSMQFGPEWLRNLSQQANESTMVIPKYQSAEHRYGREEMLALFDKSVFAPEPLRSISGLYVEKIQLPLALIQMSEEETRVWNSSVTTENIPRGLNKTISSNLTNVNPISMSSSGSTGLSRGRGTSVDRGRGRGTRGGTYHYNNRNFSEEGTDTSHPNTAFSRPRIFDRSQSHNSERNWSERNGNADYNDWNGYNNNAENGLSTSPRKDFGSTMRITSREDTNWRRRPGKDEDDSWRSSRHGRGYTNWREGGERDREKEKDIEGSEPNKDRRWMSRVVSMHSQTNRRNSENKENNLPEWATESPSEVGGSFDSSGAFHGLNSDEEECAKEKEYEKPRNELNKSNKRNGATNETSHRVDHNDMKTVNDQRKNKMKDKSSSANKNGTKKLRDHEFSELHDCPPSLDNIENSTTVLNQLKSQQQQRTSQQQLQQQSQNPQLQLQPQSSPPLQHRKEAIQNSTDDYLNVNSNKDGTIDSNRSSSQQMHKPKIQDAIPQSQCNLEFEAPNSSTFDSGFALNHCDPSSVLGLNAGNYPNITSSSGSNLDGKLLITPVDIVSNSISLMNQNDGIDKGFTISTTTVVPKEKEEELDGIVGDVVSKIMEEEEKVEKLKRLENMNKWFYRDPQGVVQGPFSSTEMAEWFRLGYFHDKTLMVRRASENNYYPLQKLVSVYGQTPFENVTLQNIDNYAPRLPLNVMGSGGIPHTNMTDDALLLSQPYQPPYDIQSLYARQALAANKRQLSQAPDELKSLYEQQRLISSQINSSADANSAVPPAIPLVQGYMHPIIPTLPSNNHSLVLLLNQIQQQQQHQQLQQHLLQQRLQQQQQQHQQQQQQQQSHQHQHSLQSAHQSQQHQQQSQKSPQQDVKSDRVQVGLMSHLEHPLQQLMHKVNNLSTSNQIPLVQTQGNNYLQSLTTDGLQPNTSPSVSTDDSQSSNAIHNLLKQLGMTTEKQSKQVDSVWGPSNSPSVPMLNTSTFNAQLWCSQVGRIGPSSVTNSGLWTADGVPTTTAMKTEQQIIESFMKDMERKQDDSRKETEATSSNRRQEEELVRKLMEESAKKKEAENKLEEEKKAKREEEKRKKRQEEEERLRKIEEEQRKKSVEDAKRREEERRRKEEDKRKKEDEKEHKRKLDEEKKRLEQKRKDAEDTQRKQTNAVRRLKEQQATATANEKSSKPAPALEISSDQQPKTQKQIVNANSSNKPLLKSQSGIVEDSKKQFTDCNRIPTNEDRVSSKQLAKSKSTPSVTTQGQKTFESEKKEKKKKERNTATVSAWPDQKKITNVKSLAEIQAEEQKQLAKQIEKDRSERLLQQQQAVATAQAAKEAANVNIWNSQNQPWKTNLTWTSAVSPSSSTLNNKNEPPATGKAWNEQNRVTPAAAAHSVNKIQPTTANTVASVSVNKSALGNTNAIVKNTTSVKSKQKKEDPGSKKATSLTLAIPKNDELSKWGVKALSNLKPSVDVPTFIAFLREVESPNDVMEYVTDYLGDGKEIKSFVKQFLEKRSVFMPTGSASVTFNATVTSTVSGTSVSKKNKKKLEEVPSNATKEPVKQPASKQNSLEFTEVKGKMKKSKKKPMLRLDSAFLGFNVTAAPDRINVGDRDYGEDLY